MCDICKSAGAELKTFLTQLVEKYPGTSVEHQGEQVPVPKTHHVFTALVVESQPYVVAEMDFIAQQQELHQPKGLFGQRLKDIAA